MVLRLVLLFGSCSSWILPEVLIEMMHIVLMVMYLVEMSMGWSEAVVCDIFVTSISWPVELMQVVMSGRRMVSVVRDILCLVSMGVSIFGRVVEVPPDSVIVVGLILEVLWVLDEIVVDKFIMIRGCTEMLNQLVLENKKLLDRHLCSYYKLL